MPKVYAIDGLVPVVHPTAFVHPSAVLVGDVIVGARAYIGPVASLRGDFGRIIVEEGANIQDGCILHGFAGKDTVVGADCTVGHGAILHGCTVEDRCLIGMGAILLNGSRIGSDSIVAAGTLVTERFEVPPGSLVMGSPGRVRRSLTDEERAFIRESAGNYVQYRLAYLPNA
jgi:phenylacetic acid degradation protein